MAKLSTQQRKNLSSSTFAGPGRSFPIPDKSHARAAIRMAARSLKKGNLSQSQHDRIVAKARRMLGKSRGDDSGSRASKQS